MREPGGNRLSATQRHVSQFVKDKAGGFEKLGASRGTTQTNIGSVTLIRADGYSNDDDAITNSEL